MTYWKASLFALACALFTAGCVEEVYYTDRPRGGYYGGGGVDFYYVSTRPYSRLYGPLYYRSGSYYYRRGGRYIIYDRPTRRYERREYRREYRDDDDRDWRARRDNDEDRDRRRKRDERQEEWRKQSYSSRNYLEGRERGDISVRGGRAGEGEDSGARRRGRAKSEEEDEE